MPKIQCFHCIFLEDHLQNIKEMGWAQDGSQGSIFYVRNLQISPPPFSQFYKLPPSTSFRNHSAQFFRALRGKFNELGCKIYTPYSFFMLIYLFLYFLLIYVHFSPFFVIACYFPPFCKKLPPGLQNPPPLNAKYRSQNMA